MRCDVEGEGEVADVAVDAAVGVDVDVDEDGVAVDVDATVGAVCVDTIRCIISRNVMVLNICMCMSIEHDINNKT